MDRGMQEGGKPYRGGGGVIGGDLAPPHSAVYLASKRAWGYYPNNSGKL